LIGSSGEFDADVFEDALLEHLRDIRDEEEEVREDNYYHDEDEENDEEPEPSLSKTQLLKVLDVIRKEAKKRHAKLKKKSIEEHHHSKHVKMDQVHLQTKHFDANNIEEKKSAIHIHEAKKENVISNNAKRENVRSDPANNGNSQVASVEFDNSLEKENEKLNKIDLRGVLAKDGNSAVTSPPKPSHAHIKQEDIASAKQSKAGLDQISFIGLYLYIIVLIPVGKIAEKEVCQSIFLTIWHCISSVELTKTHSFRLFFSRFCLLGLLSQQGRLFYVNLITDVKTKHLNALVDKKIFFSQCTFSVKRKRKHF